MWNQERPDNKFSFLQKNFENKNDLVHNNLSDKLLHEEIREYSVMIDSKDRNYQVFPDPFNYTVTLGPMTRTSEIVDGKRVYYEEPTPTIDESFSNVRYIELCEVILPLYNKIYYRDIPTYDNDVESRPQINVHKPLTDNLYLTLKIGPEFSNNNNKSTNGVLSDSFATIYNDCKANSTHYYGCMKNARKTFPQDQLAKIHKLRIQFTDPYGNPLTCPHLDKSIHSDMVCECVDPEGDENTDCFRHNLFHPLNPLFQHHLHFKIGVVESRLSKKNF